MNKNQQFERESIVGRVVEFMRLHPPFSFMAEEVLNDTANASAMVYFDKGEAVFNFGDSLHDSIYVIRKGEVRIVSQTGELVDQCGEGELFGSRAFMSSETYMASAIADPEALIIKVPVSVMRDKIAQDPRITEYFFGDFSSGVALRKRKLSEINSHFGELKKPSSIGTERVTEVIDPSKTPITCTPETTIQEAASIMSEKGIGSIIITSEENHPIGIVTNSDLRDKVATGKNQIAEPVSAIMSSPVKTVSSHLSGEEYLLEMMAQSCHHLCITKEGSNNEPLVSIVTDHDLLVSLGNNPVVLMKELRSTSNQEERKAIVAQFDEHIENLVLNDQPILPVAKLVGAFNRQLLKQLIEEQIETKKLGLTKDDFCWLALGSTARSEQIIRTDFDSAIVYRDSSLEKTVFTDLANSVFEQLIDLGYQSDKAGIQANNSEWIMPLESWESTFKNWIAVPEEKALLYATIFFDLMPFYGNKDLASELQKSIHSHLKGNRSYTAFLAQNALQNPPPLGFFKNLLLEKSGEHKNSFDIKARAMMPLADAARLRALEFDVLFPSNTISRYERLTKADPNNAPRYEDCAVAYEIFMRIRALEGMTNKNDGRYCNPQSLTQLEKQVLKNAFAPIASIQNLVKPA